MIEQLKRLHPGRTVVGPNDDAFKRYGSPLANQAWTDLAERTRRLIDAGEAPAYLPSCAELEDPAPPQGLLDGIFGGEEVQVGVCRGFNDTLDGMEWHDSSEVVVACTPMVLILGLVEEMQEGEWSSDHAVFCFLNTGDAVELHEGTLHFAPCRVGEEPFLSIIVLPRGVNGELPQEKRDIPPLWKVRKWLITHAESPQRKAGAAPGIVGDNIRIRPLR